MTKNPDPQPDPNPPAQPEPSSDPKPAEPAESLADTEGELQDFLGSDQAGGEERLDLSQVRLRQRD